MFHVDELEAMTVLSNIRASLTTNRPLKLGEVMGWASILMSLWLGLTAITDEAWIAGALFPVGALAFAIGMAAKQRAYGFLLLNLTGLLLVSGLVVFGYPAEASLPLLIVAGGFFNGLVLLLGYIYPDLHGEPARPNPE